MYDWISEDQVLNTIRTGDILRVVREYHVSGVGYRTDHVEGPVGYTEDGTVYDLAGIVLYDPTDEALDSVTTTFAVYQRDKPLNAYVVGDTIYDVLTDDLTRYEALMKHAGGRWVGMLGFTPVIVESDEILHWFDKSAQKEITAS